MNLDNFNEIVGKGINIFGSREKIRSGLIENAKKYLQLEGLNDSLYRTSLVSYIVDTLSILSANQLFYDSVIYREFFMVEAQFQESVYNLARWIGYTVPKAIPATIDIFFKIPLTFNSNQVNFTVPNSFKATAGTIPFLIDVGSYTTPAATFILDKQKLIDNTANIDLAASGQILNDSSLIIRDGNGFLRPVFVEEDARGVRYATFALPFKQQEKRVFQFVIPDTVQQYQFFSKKFNFNGMVSAIKVWVIEPNSGEKFYLDNSNSQNFNPNDKLTSIRSGSAGNLYEWNQWYESEHGIYTMESNSKQFVFVGGDNKGELFFGNGIVGKQPEKNSIITVEFYITKGEEGAVIPNSITKGDSLYYTVVPMVDSNGDIIGSDSTSKLHSISYSIYNANSPIGGTNTPSLPEIKRNAIINLRSKAKLVSELDYDDINTIMGPSFPTVEAYPILKRSDIKTNEILAFLRLLYHDEFSVPQIIPTRNAYIELLNPVFNSLGQYTIMRTSKFLIDNEYYETLFNFTIDTDTMTAQYDYVAKNIFGSPVSRYNDEIPSFYKQYLYIPITGIDYDVIIDEDAASSSSATSNIYAGNKNYPLSIAVKVNHIPIENAEDYSISEIRARMVTKWGNNQSYDQTAFVSIDGIYSQFNFEIPNYLEVPTDVQRFEFYLDIKGIARNSNGDLLNSDGMITEILSTDVDGNYTYTNGPPADDVWMPLQSYYSDIVIRKDLSDVMKSEVKRTRDWDGIYHDNDIKYTIHNIPAILSSYLNDGLGGGVLNRTEEISNPNNFEIVVMQKLLQNLGLDERRMLTDFINIKFPDTYGTINNLKYNPVEHIVESRFHTPFNWESPSDILFDSSVSSSSSSAISGSKYIINGEVPGYQNTNVSSYINYIGEWFSNGTTGIWYMIKPRRGMYVRVNDELDETDKKKVIAYDGERWVDVQKFKIPLVIKLKVELNPVRTISEEQLKTNIKTQLMSHFGPLMGIQKRLDRSEIVTVVRATDGVMYCEVIEPGIDIRFDYNIKDLTQQELLDYTPQYIGFTEDSISIEVVNKV